ncbi:baculoviral IAP repeat-containing protein 7 [Neopsephotus bourkii]|uniref:baculoviral IAP repeat-containing protein 7 n=1 Tax=Neopsephotus bourkii TaxID=309878 RepID=UPI002AA55CE6|nr:baculoviral IAP repeat-containing protein 7 [Neopsephotus bourkii]
MGDRRPAKETVPRDASCHLFKRSMRNEARRLGTFRQWPSTSPVSAQDLAKAGFFYVGPRDEVRCFCCSGILKDWAPGDCPMAEHRKFFPSCKFVCGEAVGNQEMLPLQETIDTVDGQVVSLLQGMDSEEAALPHEPEYPAMVTEEARLLTFQNCPQYCAVYCRALARAGFFYTGQDGIVRCFCCNGGVRNWQIESDPWQEHARLFPGCEFLLQSRGRDFVSSVQESLSNTQVPNKHMMTGASYVSGSELTADVLQEVRVKSSSAESRGAAQGDAEASSSREEMQSVQQRESDEFRLSMEKQLQRLQEERMCKVCLDKDASVVFVPCGHLVACRECAFNLRKCPICRAVIQDRVRTFMS